MTLNRWAILRDIAVHWIKIGLAAVVASWLIYTIWTADFSEFQHPVPAPKDSAILK